MSSDERGCLATAGITFAIAAVSVLVGHMYGTSFGLVAFFALMGGWFLIASVR